MEVYNLSISSELTLAVELCKNLLEKHTLIPIVGAGFSINTPTDNGGIIPTAKQLQGELYQYVEKYSGYGAHDLEDIKGGGLQTIASCFWNIKNRIPEEKTTEFYSYIQKNFQRITFFKEFQESFLKVRWPYLFTLNYDSLIEDYDRQYYPVIPYDQINKRFFQEKTRLYKLHGDAKKFLETGDSKYLILSRDQYVTSMMDDSNQDMLNELQTAFSSKSILFFGCSLTDELDLLYSSQFAIREKVRNINPAHQSIIYINFEQGSDSSLPLSMRTQDTLVSYGVTHVIRIFSESQSKTLFRKLYEFTQRLPQPGIEGSLEKYTSIRHHVLKTDDIESRDFLFQEQLVWRSFNDHTITMPGYCIERSALEQMIKYVSEAEPLIFISGNYFSGKTIFLIELSKYYTSKKVYIFPSGSNLNDLQLDFLLERENCICCFDSKTLTVAQIKRLSTELNINKVKHHNSCMAIVIDASDAPMYKYIFEARNASRVFQQIRLSGVLDIDESEKFNKRIGAISLPPYSIKHTLLDYIVENEKELLRDSDIYNRFMTPLDELLSKNAKNRIKALIMLATEIRISAKRAIQFGIDEHINDIIKHCTSSKTGVIEKDYSVYSGDYSGYEFVCNSKYWIIRVLSDFANSKANSINIIAEAYLDIIQIYNRMYKDDNVMFYQSCEPYYFFDHIQVLFNQRWFKNSSKLMNSIYDKLLPVLSDSYQFLHQKAKGRLVVGQLQIKSKKYDDAKATLKEALYNITRAIKLAEQFPKARNIEETILHMTYTKGRILIQLSNVSMGYVPQAVDTCYQLYQMQSNIQDDAYDFTNGTGGDKIAFDMFKRTLINNSTVHTFEDLDTNKLEFLIGKWTGKIFRIVKRKNKR